ncbi:hypothetical protein LY76DRAFT_509476 [Colletotrichum caudatum]|nr:hypothetical protein LY76DRAFT_509476 [Colletotrichum caudatum]
MPSDSLKSGIYPILPSPQDNTHDITYDLPSTKCLGTFRSMATASTPSAENRPLNHSVVFPPVPPISRAASGFFPSGSSGDDASPTPPRVLARFAFGPVAALRVAAVPLAIALVVIEVQGKTRRDGLATFFIVLASMQLAWLVVALLAQSHFSRAAVGGGRRGGGGGGGQGNGFTVDLGFFECVFGRRRRRKDDVGEAEGMLAWMKKDGAGKRGSRADTVYTVVDIAFATITLTAGIFAATDPRCWSWGLHAGVAVFGIILGRAKPNRMFEGVIALAQQFAVFWRGRIQVVWDAGEEEDDLGSHKYRIRLPQSPEQRHATMSVAA